MVLGLLFAWDDFALYSMCLIEINDVLSVFFYSVLFHLICFFRIFVNLNLALFQLATTKRVVKKHPDIASIENQHTQKPSQQYNEMRFKSNFKKMHCILNSENTLRMLSVLTSDH